ncbi:hypothetical protein OUZ56_022456 [Daphnia magna]|uniref:Uncharacterized protein n=1 Tax=Daphnia magna TaxID=35525 RepID=A0ABR0AWF0_9CRUS|nr:hypothetical protein OUZ56_022456 [Daphnia magna]
MADTSKIATFAIIRFDNSQILFPFVVFIYVETEERWRAVLSMRWGETGSIFIVVLSRLF